MALRFFARSKVFITESLKFSKTLSSITLRTPQFSAIPHKILPPPSVSDVFTPFPSKPIPPYPLKLMFGLNDRPLGNICCSSTPFLIFRRLISVLPSDLYRIKTVCMFDLASPSVEQYLDACKRVLWRFPLVDRKGESLMRRTVRPGEFEYGRSFLFLGICFDNVGPCYLLISTETTDLVGIKGKDRLFLFKEELFEKKKEVAHVAGVKPDQICLLKLNLPAVSIYSNDPSLYNCKAAVEGLMNLLMVNNVSGLETYKKLEYSRCLAFVHALCFKGSVLLSTNSHVKYNFAKLELHGDDTGYLRNLNDFLNKDQWESMSNAWHLGEKKWTVYGDLELDIEDEFGIVKAAPVVDLKLTTQYNDTSKKEREFQKACEDGTRHLPFPERLAALSAWKAAKAGVDVDEFLDENGYMGGKELVAREAWKEAVEVLELLDRKLITKVSSLASLSEGTQGLNLEVEIRSSEIVFDRSYGPTFKLARVEIFDESGSFMFVARNTQVDILIPGRRVNMFNGRVEKYNDRYAVAVKYDVGSIVVKDSVE